MGKRPGGSRPWRRTVASIITRDAGICHLCGKPGANSADHLIPVAQGGTDHPTNLAAAHLQCNKIRGTRNITTARNDLQKRTQPTNWHW